MDNYFSLHNNEILNFVRMKIEQGIITNPLTNGAMRELDILVTELRDTIYRVRDFLPEIVSSVDLNNQIVEFFISNMNYGPPQGNLKKNKYFLYLNI